jgi:hypothetical protein
MLQYVTQLVKTNIMEIGCEGVNRAKTVKHRVQRRRFFTDGVTQADFIDVNRQSCSRYVTLYIQFYFVYNNRNHGNDTY